MIGLMTAAVDAGTQAMAAGERRLVVSGRAQPADADDLSSNMERLRQLFDLFEQKTWLLQLLDMSQPRAGRADLSSAASRASCRSTRCSVVTAPYEVEGQVVGTLGVIGPTRMAYERVIPIVDITAKLLSNALTLQLSERDARRGLLTGQLRPSTSGRTGSRSVRNAGASLVSHRLPTHDVINPQESRIPHGPLST